MTNASNYWERPCHLSPSPLGRPAPKLPAHTVRFFSSSITLRCFRMGSVASPGHSLPSTPLPIWISHMTTSAPVNVDSLTSENAAWTVLLCPCSHHSLYFENFKCLSKYSSNSTFFWRFLSIPVMGDNYLCFTWPEPAQSISIWFLTELVTMLQNYSLSPRFNEFYLLNIYQTSFIQGTNNFLILPKKTPHVHFQESMLNWSLIVTYWWGTFEARDGCKAH